MQILVVDTETSGIPKPGHKWDTHYKEYPRVLEIAWQVIQLSDSLIDQPQVIYETKHYLKQEDNFKCCTEAARVNGITEELLASGHDQKHVLRHFILDALNSQKIIGHNIHFDTGMIKANLLRIGVLPESFSPILNKEKRTDTMTAAIPFMDQRGLGTKWPKLTALYKEMFGEELKGAHGALADVQATARVYFELKRLGFINN